MKTTQAQHKCPRCRILDYHYIIKINTYWTDNCVRIELKCQACDHEWVLERESKPFQDIDRIF